MTTMISIPVDEDVAKLYNAATEQERLKLQIMLQLWLRDAARHQKPLGQLMDEISDRAIARGMTEEILKNII
jgi:hypothetical protein